jgi:hypothetical protein
MTYDRRAGRIVINHMVWPQLVELLHFQHRTGLQHAELRRNRLLSTSKIQHAPRSRLEQNQHARAVSVPSGDTLPSTLAVDPHF